MAGNGCGERIRESAEFLSSPQIAHWLGARASDTRPANRGVGRRDSTVEQSDRSGAVGERPGPDFPEVFAPDAVRGLAERVLVDVDDFVVGEQRERERIELRQVRADEQ